MNTSKKWILSISMIAMIGALSACGRTTTQDVLPIPSPIYPVPNPTPTPTGTATPDPGFMPAMTFSFSMTGDGGTSPSYTTPPLNTDNLLKVRVSAGAASINSVPDIYTGFQGTYSCISYNITAIGQTVTTSTLTVPNTATAYGPSQCPSAPANQVLDFSNRLGPGHGPVTLTVSSARYDYYCQQFWENYFIYGIYSLWGSNPGLYCPLHVVYKNHTVTGNLEIQVNGTTLGP